ncbi:MAG: tetratricopeptide repeat protein [Candidatus Handelsmanbacteria bacterium]|nr:tetratricopeptide repeat protein [Candidatus Handelsmanbacteria bacterium]
MPYFRQAIEREDQNAQYFYNLGVSYLNLGRQSEAIAAFETCVARKPDADAYVNLGVLYANAGQRERGRASFARALELAPNHPQAAIMRRELQAGQ